VFFVVVIALTMATMNPVLLLLSFACSLTANVLMCKGRDMWFYLILLFAIGITNPLFSHNGETVLFYLFEQRITMEAFIYGLVSGVRIVAAIFWFRLFGAVFKQDKLNWLMGKISPKLSVVFSMALRFIPLVKKNAKDIYNAQLSILGAEPDKLTDKMRLVFNVFSALVSMSIENAIETADTMKSRGIENKNRSAFSLFFLRLKDIFFLSVTIIGAFIVSFSIFSGVGSFYYYPAIRFEVHADTYILYASYFLICALPIINDLLEDLRWKYSISKI
jgi:energy-coupling factor transport system permease protein